MLIYNQSRSFQCYVDQDGSPDVKRVTEIIKRRGWNGIKGYFLAHQDGASGELVLSDAILPTQAW